MFHLLKSLAEEGNLIFELDTLSFEHSDTWVFVFEVFCYDNKFMFKLGEFSLFIEEGFINFSQILLSFVYLIAQHVFNIVVESFFMHQFIRDFWDGLVVFERLSFEEFNFGFEFRNEALEFVLKLLFGNKNILGVFLKVEQVLCENFIVMLGLSE